MIGITLRRARLHAALSLTLLLAASIPGCGRGSKDSAYCYVAASDPMTCRCYTSPETETDHTNVPGDVKVATCGATWDFCCQWGGTCECYKACSQTPGSSYCLADGVRVGEGTCTDMNVTDGSGEHVQGPVVSACGPAGGAGGGPGGGGQCTNEEPHTTYASCNTDGDCYSGYCNESCHPGPCCAVATDTVRDEGRSYDCTSDADCEAVAPDLVTRGGVAACVRPGNTMAHEVCSFHCDAP